VSTTDLHLAILYGLSLCALLIAIISTHQIVPS
jgi:hypothetical protein